MKLSKKLLSKILLILGIGLILYPIISNFYYETKFKTQIKIYDSNVNSNKINENKLLGEAKKYNKSLDGISIIDPFNEEVERKSLSSYNDILNINGIMGYIQIPKIKVNIPIKHGVSEETLNSSAGHLEGTSLPIGDKNHNSVITAHRGLPSAKLFTDLDKMEYGDVFIIKILSKKYIYEVIDIKVIDPDEVHAIDIQKDKDLVTLLTCTPYGINSHRLLVIGERVDVEENFDTVLDDVKTYIKYFKLIPFIIIVIYYLIRMNKNE